MFTLQLLVFFNVYKLYSMRPTKHKTNQRQHDGLLMIRASVSHEMKGQDWLIYTKGGALTDYFVIVDDS